MTNLSRRTLLTALPGTRLLPASPALAPAAPQIWRNRQPGMAYRRLGRTNYMISEVIFGTQRVTPDDYRHVEMALEMGLNYLDTAPAYSKTLSEQGLAKVIAGGKRERVFLTTKLSPWMHNRNGLFRQIFDSLPEPEQKKLLAQAREIIAERHADAPDYYCGYFQGQRQALEGSMLSNVMERRFGHRIDRKANYRDLIFRSVEESLGRLKTHYVDLLMCPHGANSREEVTQFPEIFEAFEALKKQGKVRHLGVTAHSDPAGVLKGAIEAKVYSAAMIAYNIVNHRYVDKALDEAAAADLGVIAMKAARPVYPNRLRLDEGALPDPEWVALLEQAMPGPLSVPQKAYSWVLRDRRIAAVCSEMTSADMVKQNLSLVVAALAAAGRASPPDRV